MKKILITNDDGITADGLIRLARAARKYGEVWVIAPDHQCSAMSHHITLHENIFVKPEPDFPVEGVHAYSSTGTPADCVRFGILNFVKAIPDAVLSGINFGYNCGSDIQYSGTAAGAFEGASVGAFSLAISEGANGVHEVTDVFLDKILGEYLDANRHPLEFNTIWNINFPECHIGDFAGIVTDRTVARDAFYIDTYIEEPQPDGTIKLTVHGDYHEEAAEGTDFRACVDNCISIGIVRNITTG